MISYVWIWKCCKCIGSNTYLLGIRMLKIRIMIVSGSGDIDFNYELFLSLYFRWVLTSDRRYLYD